MTRTARDADRKGGEFAAFGCGEFAKFIAGEFAGSLLRRGIGPQIINLEFSAPLLVFPECLHWESSGLCSDLGNTVTA